MIIPKRIIKEWKKVILDAGITQVAKEAGVNFRTIKRTLEVGQCKDKTYDKLLAYVLVRKETIKAKLQTVEDDSN